ncbi:MAG: creatininase family protein [Phycisphaerae bacterium]|jgi:creatinine amidohydrolase|nr:creatininase family protein [Phycisphaerae bacterium]
MIDEWDLTATNLHRISQRDYEVAVLPVGAVEPHNRHLPQGQDFRHTAYVARESCRIAWDQCESVICLPTLPYGVDCNLMAFPMAIHVSQTTLDAMVREIIGSLLVHGIRKIVILNGHGGNDFTPLIRQIQCDLDVHVFLCDWWTVGRDKYDEIFDRPDDHAGQLETSVALALYPELVEQDTAGDGKTREYLFEALREGWVRTSRRFDRLNDHCASGDPTGATPDRGNAYLELVCGRIAKFLAELAGTPIDDIFPHK